MKEEGTKVDDMGVSTESGVDGKDSVDYSHVDLPRGWRGLKRLYTYDKPESESTATDDAKPESTATDDAKE